MFSENLFLFAESNATTPVKQYWGFGTLYPSCLSWMGKKDETLPNTAAENCFPVSGATIDRTTPICVKDQYILEDWAGLVLGIGGIVWVVGFLWAIIGRSKIAILPLILGFGLVLWSLLSLTSDRVVDTKCKDAATGSREKNCYDAINTVCVLKDDKYRNGIYTGTFGILVGLAGILTIVGIVMTFFPKKQSTSSNPVVSQQGVELQSYRANVSSVPSNTVPYTSPQSPSMPYSINALTPSPSPSNIPSVLVVK
jgi:hypothetical protein